MYQEFFDAYGKAFSDSEKLAAFYADCAMASTPTFVGCLKNRDEVNSALASIAQSQLSTGMIALTPVAVEASKIDEIHHWVKVKWNATFQKVQKLHAVFDISYVLRDEAGRLKIVFYISHQDEEQMRKELGVF